MSRGNLFFIMEYQFSRNIIKLHTKSVGDGALDVPEKQNRMAKDGSSKPLPYGEYEIFISYFEK